MIKPKHLIIFFCLQTVVLVVRMAPCYNVCEPIQADLCTALSNNYNETKFPTKWGFISQNDALLQFNSFIPLFQTNCSTKLAHFLCSYYFPPCLTGGACKTVELEPCQDLCTEVQSQCEPVLKDHNYTWIFNCSEFTPKQPCFEVPTQTTTPEPTISPIAPRIDTCISVNNSVCATLHPDYSTSFPNKNFTSQEDADLHFYSFGGDIINHNCSDQLKLLLCGSHYPACLPDVQDNSSVILLYPCKNVCKQVRKNCEELLLMYNASWPDLLDCDTFPSKKDELCIEEIPDPKCEPLDPRVQEICGVLDDNYKMTAYFPYGGFKTQNDAYKEFESHLEFYGNCSAELLAYLCYHYFPSCSLDQEEPKVPCRSVCRKASKGCEDCFEKENITFKWPDEFKCDQYRVNKNCITLKDIDSYTDKFDSQSCKSE